MLFGCDYVPVCVCGVVVVVCVYSCMCVVGEGIECLCRGQRADVLSIILDLIF